MNNNGSQEKGLMKYVCRKYLVNDNLLYNIKLTKLQYGTKTSNVSHDNNILTKPEIICDKCKRYEHY